MKICAYCRVSTSSKEQLSSLENQKTFFESYAKLNNYTLVKIYADSGISGKSAKNRKEFLNMLSDSKLKLFDMVVVKDISRFARNTLDFLKGIREIQSNGVKVRFLSCNMESLGESEFVLTMFAALAQEESYNLSKRIMFGKTISASKGRTPSVIFGYDKIDTYNLKINEDEANTVRKIFNLYTKENMGFRKIANYLNENLYKSKKGNLWSAKTVSRIIKNPIYKGVLINNKTKSVNFMEGIRKTLDSGENYIHNMENLRIISDRTFNRAEKILNKHKKADTNRSC